MTQALMTEEERYGQSLHTTRDFIVHVGTSEAADLPPELRKVFFVRHRATGVLHGRTNILSQAIYGAEEFQKELDQAIKDPKHRPERPLSAAEQAALLAFGPQGAGN